MAHCRNGPKSCVILRRSMLVFAEKIEGDSGVVPDGLFDGLGVLGALDEGFPGVEVIAGVEIAVGDVVVFF